MKKLQILLAFLACTTAALNAQNVNIPDANFKALLVANSGINTNADTLIQLTEAAAFTGGIYVSNSGIASLVGIEAFTALTTLDCSYNQLSSLDLSSNTTLITLYCFHNQLSSLDISADTALTYLDCSINQLSSLDLSSNTALTYLDCSHNQLSSLDVSSNTALTTLDCSFNQLSSLDVSSNTALTTLYCFYNWLSSLDISACNALRYLYCYNNQLSSLDVSSNTALITLCCFYNQLSSLNTSSNTALSSLLCYNNQLTTLDLTHNTYLGILFCSFNQLSNLDLSSNTYLTDLRCYNNQLNSLNMKNGNNTVIAYFDTRNNPNLTCIEVDSVAYSNANWTNIDAAASFSTNCISSSINSIGDDKINISAYPNPTNGNFTINLEKTYQDVSLTVHNVMGQTVFFKEYPELNQITLDLEGSAGIYFVNLRTEQGEAVLKIIKN